MTLLDELLTEENIDSVRRTFSGEHGRKTLDIIMILGGFVRPNLSDAQDIAKRNLCVDLLQFLGPSENLERSNEFIMAITDALCAIPIKSSNGGKDDRTGE